LREGVNNEDSRQNECAEKEKKLAKRLAASFNDTSGFIIYFDF
jgi:hypothetical protein